MLNAIYENQLNRQNTTFIQTYHFELPVNISTLKACFLSELCQSMGTILCLFGELW